MSSSPDVIMLPSARAAEKTTPITVSTASLERLSIPQISKVPNRRAAIAPASGWMRRRSAAPIPGSATCDKASLARTIRRMATKHPRTPAAADIATRTTTDSMVVVDMQAHWSSESLLERLGRHDVPWRSKPGPASAKTEHVRRMTRHQAELVGDEQDGCSLFHSELPQQFVQPFLAWLIDARSGLVKEKDWRIANERESEEEQVELPTRQSTDGGCGLFRSQTDSAQGAPKLTRRDVSQPCPRSE